MQRQIGQVSLVPRVISRLCSTVPTEMRHCPTLSRWGTCHPKPELSSAVLGVKDQDPKIHFFPYWMVKDLIQKKHLLLPVPQLSFCISHLYIILIISCRCPMMQTIWKSGVLYTQKQTNISSKIETFHLRLVYLNI